MSILALAVPGGAQTADFSDVATAKGLGGYDASTGDFHGPGAIFADLTGDGYPDLYLMRAGTEVGTRENELYVNVPDGTGGRRFERIVNPLDDSDDPGAANGAVAGDYDNDGDLDIYLLNWRQDNVLLQNRWVEEHPAGGGQPTDLYFVDVTASTDPTPTPPVPSADDQHGLARATYQNPEPELGNDVLHNSLTAAWADVNRDGHLDLYHGSHDGTDGDPSNADCNPGEPPEHCRQLGERDTLYINNGDGTFTDITMGPPWPVPDWEPVTGFVDENGECCDKNPMNPEAPREFSSTNAVTFGDFDNDRWPDLLVTNKSGTLVNRDMLYMNLGNDASGNWLGFELVTYQPTAGNVPFGTETPADMGVVTGDIDNDGDLDAYTSLGSNPQNFPHGIGDGNNAVWINRLADTGTLFFDQDKDMAEAVWSWGVHLEDFDNNGRLDFHAATHGGARDFLYLQSSSGVLTESAESAGTWQFPLNSASFGNPGADYNRDGWVDFFVVNRTGGNASALFENQSAAGNPGHRFLVLDLEGNPSLPGPLKSTHDAMGARALVATDLDGDGAISATETLRRDVVSGSGNAASTSSLALELGTGLGTEAVVRILWPSGRETVTTTPTDRFLSFVEGAGDLVAHYPFDADFDDVAGVADGAESGFGPDPFSPLSVIGDGALTFDGFDDHLAIETLHYRGTDYGALTVAGWVRTDNDGNQILLSFDRSEYFRIGVAGAFAGPGQLSWHVATAAGIRDLASGGRVDDGAWHHFAGVFDGANGTMKVYVDGQLDGTLEGLPDSFGTGQSRYGYVGVGSEAAVFDGGFGPPNRLDGDLDDLRIYSRALGDAEIESLYRSGRPVIGEAGRLTPPGTGWQTVQLTNTYAEPVVVLQPVSYNGGDPTTIRVRAVSPQSFQYRVEEWDYLVAAGMGGHLSEDLAYAVVEAGVHTLPGGASLEAGVLPSVTDAWTMTSFSQSFGGLPVVLTQCVTVLGSEAVTTRNQAVTATGFEVRLQEQEAGAGADGSAHVAEAVAWLAVSQASEAGVFEAARTGPVVTSAQDPDGIPGNGRWDPIWYSLSFATSPSDPVFLAAMVSTIGIEPATLRYRSGSLGTAGVDIFVQEEQSADDDMQHALENVGYLVFDRPGPIRSSFE